MHKTSYLSCKIPNIGLNRFDVLALTSEESVYNQQWVSRCDLMQYYKGFYLEFEIGVGIYLCKNTRIVFPKW